MVKLRNMLALAAALQASVLAADPELLRLVMPDAKVVAGLQVDRARNSPFGQFVLSRMQLEDESFKKFMRQTGFDPRRDVTEVMLASNWDQAAPQSRWLVLARGTFHPEQISAAALANGGAITNFQGVDIVTGVRPPKKETDTAAAETQNGIAFFDTSNAVLGDIASVKGAIQRKKSSAVAGGPLVAKVRELSARNDFWFVTLVPLSEFAGVVPDPNLSGAMQGNLLAAVHEASGGIRFGDNVTISGEAVTRSDKDAQALVDVFKFLAGMVQLNSKQNKTAGQVSTLLDAMELKTEGNVMTLSLAIPEQQLEQILQTMRQETQAPAKKPPQNK